MAEDGNIVIADRIDNYLTTSTVNGYSGAVLVARNGQIILSSGYGLGHRATATPITSSTIFNIGAITQSFTAAAVMKLVEEGKLSTSDTLGELFDIVPFGKRQITIHQLLSHTAGFSSRAGGYRYDFATRDQSVNELFNSNLRGKPGDIAGAGYILLAAIVEQVSGIPFEEYLQSRLLIPAGMHATGYLLPDWDLERVAHAYFYDVYTRDWIDWGTTLDQFSGQGVSWYGMGRGDLQSTVEDLYAWHQALQSGGILDPALQALMETPHVLESGGRAHGYGWRIEETSRGTTMLSHRGSNGYFYADFMRFPEEDAAVIHVSNVLRDADIADNITNMLFDPGFNPVRFPREKYELVIGYIETHQPEEVATLPGYYENLQQRKLDDPAILHPIGLQLMNAGEHDWAVALLELNVQLFPQEGNFWDSLGDAYMANGQESQAAASYRESLRLAPARGCFWCSNATSMLEKLGREASGLQL